VRGDEPGHLRGAARQVVHVELAIGEALEIAQGAVLGDIAAWRDDAGARHQLAAEIEELVLVAAGAVEQEQHRGLVGGPLALAECVAVLAHRLGLPKLQRV
jgi:hypothetical protein